MGRRKEDPVLQAAKGYPGRRKSKVEAEIEAAAQAAEAAPATPDNPFPVPELFMRAPVYWQIAIRVWNEQSEVLRASGRRRPGYRYALCRYCTWMQFYLASADQLRRDLPKGGTTQRVKKGDGEIVIRPHPSIDMMARAETSLRLLEAEFGFTPVRDQDLVRVESFNAGQGKLPLAGVHPGQTQPQTIRDTAGTDPFDLMNEADSPPPASLQH